MTAPFNQPIFETGCTLESATIVCLPVCYDGTASYGKGTAQGPAAIMAAYHQLDYEDPRFREPDRFGVYVDDEITFDATASADQIGDQIRRETRRRADEILGRGQIPALIGGEHSVSQGAIEACADHAGGIGLLQIDAHMDLRLAYEGYRHSHASVIRNVVDGCEHVSRVIQVGIRDYCREEQDLADASSGRIHTLRDDDFVNRLDSGIPARQQFEEAVALLPEWVYVTFDIDGLDPANCPGTGTPVPGGLSFHHAAMLLGVLAESGRRIVGFDLVEVAPLARRR